MISLLETLIWFLRVGAAGCAVVALMLFAGGEGTGALWFLILFTLAAWSQYRLVLVWERLATRRVLWHEMRRHRRRR